MEEYYKKNREYIKVLAVYLEELQVEIGNTKDDMFKISNLNSYRIVLENKLDTLKLTDSLIIQEYVKLNQLIVNHCITINSLLMSRNTLIPLISTEMIIGNGINSEKEGLDVTKNLLALLNDIVSQDIDGTEEVLDKLRNIDTSSEQLMLLTRTVNEQLNQMKMLRSLEGESSLELPVMSNIEKELLDNNSVKKKKKLY